MEIERKFLLPALPQFVNIGKRYLIQQGYICFDKEREVRIRKIGASCFLTYKRGSGLVRIEEEIPISEKRFENLWPETEGFRLSKTRYRVKNNGILLEIDLYRDNLIGLIIAEVEFDSEMEANAFEPPSYFGTEITGNTFYSNRYLLENGLPDSFQSGLSGYRVGVLPVLQIKGQPDKYVLVSSRHNNDFILPKGKVKIGMPDQETARIEALEEAGLEGKVLPETYLFESRYGLVKIYRMEVKKLLDDWKEKEERKRVIYNRRQLIQSLKIRKMESVLRLLG